MNDIKAMRAQMEEKIHWAEIENSENAAHHWEDAGLAFKCMGQSSGQVGKLQCALWDKGGGSVPLGLEAAKAALTAYPSTEPIKIWFGSDLQHDTLPYRCEVHKGPRDSLTILTLAWISNQYVISIDIAVPYEESVLSRFFRDATRPYTDSEIDVYTSLRDGHRGHTPTIHFKKWASGHTVRFYGGYQLQADEDVIMAIVQTILNPTANV